MAKPKFSQISKTTLLTSITAGETTSIVLKKLVDIYGKAVAMTDFQTKVYLTLEPGSDNEEIISCTNFTVNSDGTVALDTGIVRGLSASAPYGATGTARPHASGALVVVSNNPQLLDSILEFVVNLEDNQTIAGKKTFSTVPDTPSAPISNNDIVNKAYVDALAIGAATAVSVVITGDAGETIADGDLIYFDSVTANAWMLCDADIAGTVENVLLGIAQGAGTVGAPIASGVMLRGVDDAQAGLVAGEIMYAGNVAGDIQNTPGTTSVVIGIVPAGVTTKVYFSPRFNQMITQDQQNALQGTVGSPSLTNKYVTNDDKANIKSPTGMVSPYVGFNSPSGWLIADGSAVSRTTYASLFAVLTSTIGTFTITIASPSVVTLSSHGLSTGDAVYLTTTGALPTGLSINTQYWITKVDANSFKLSTTLADALAGTNITTTGTQSGTHTAIRCPYGVGDGTTTFNLPDLKGTAVAGLDTTQTEFAGVGQIGGEKTHTLITAEMPSHKHKIQNRLGNGSGGAVKIGQQPYVNSYDNAGLYSDWTDPPHRLETVGGNTPHNNLQPYVTMNYIIKT